MRMDKKAIPVATNGQGMGMKVNGIVHENDLAYEV